MAGRFRKHGEDKHRWRRRLLKLAAIGVFLAVGLYNLLTCSWFITKVIFPILSDRIGYNMAADAVELSLLDGHLRLVNFRFGPGWDPIVTAPRIDLDFARGSLWSGKLEISNVEAESPEVAVSRNQAGFYNVNKVRSAPRPPDPPGPVVFPETPDFHLSAENIKVRNGSFRLDYINRFGESDVALYVREIDLDADRFENGGLTDFTLSLRGQITTYSLELRDFKMRLSCHAGFTDHLLPSLAQSEATIYDITGSAGGVDMAPRTIRASGEASGDNVLNALTVKFITLEISRNDNIASSRVSVSGDLDFYPWNMTAKVTADPIDPELFDYFHNYLGVPLRNLSMTTANTFTLDYETVGLTGKMSLSDKPAEADLEYAATWSIASDKLACNRFNASVSGAGAAGIELKDSFAVDFSGDTPALLTTPTVKITATALDIDRSLDFFGVDPGWKPGTLDASLTGAFAPDLSAFSLNGAGSLAGAQPPNTDPVNAKFDFTGSLALDGSLKVDALNSTIAVGSAIPTKLCVSDAVFDLTGDDSQFTVQAESIDPALFEPAPDTAAILRELGSPLLRFGGRFTYSPARNSLGFYGVDAETTGENAPHLQVKLEPNVFMINDNIFAYPLRARAAMPGYALRGKLNPPSGAVSGGVWTVYDGFILEAGERFDYLKLDGRVAIANTDIETSAVTLNGFDLAADFGLEISGDGRFTLDAHEITAGFNSHRDLQMRMLLRHHKGGEMLMSGTVERCGAAMLAPFGLKLRSPLTASGSFDFESNASGNFRYRGEFTAQTVLAGEHKSHPMTIAGLLDLSGDGNELKLSGAELDFIAANEVLGNLSVSGFLPAQGSPDRALRLLVQSERLDAENIFALIDDTNNEDAEPRLPFIRIPVIADLDLDDIVWGDMQANLTGRLVATNRDLAFERVFLRINGAEMRLSGNLNGNEERTAYHFEATTDDAEAAALLAPFLPTMHQFSANIRHARLYISGDSLSGNGIWDTMKGKLDMDLEKIRLSHSLGNTLPGRVMLLPFSIIANLPEILPTSRTRIERLAEVVPVFTRFYENTGAVEFDQGRIALSAAGKGRINIDEFALTGSPIESFTFRGSLGFGSDRNLNLSSRMKMTTGLIVPMDIGGTLDSPEVDYAAIAAGVVSANTWRRFSWQ